MNIQKSYRVLNNGAKRPLWDPLGGARSVILEHPKERLGGMQHIYNIEHL